MARKFLMKILPVKCHHLAAYLKLQSSQNGVGGRDSPPVLLLRPVQHRGMSPSLLILSNGEGCFSLKLKTRAAIYRESTPPQFSIFNWYLKYCCPGCHTAGPCVFCDSVSDFLHVFLKLFILYFFILKSLNRPIPGCHRALFFHYVLSQ